eukprot:12605856-Prorocentrum_lima.AAC.1
MTSSLVGSEMCIRDSDQRVSLLASWALPRARWRLSSSLVPLLLLAPVSYTHLTLPTICSV